MTETVQERRSARVLAAVLAAQALVCLGGYAFVVAVWEAPPLGGLAVGYLGTLALSALAAATLWRAGPASDASALVASLAGFALVLTAVMAGLWYLVPFQALPTIGAFLALTERYTVEDEAHTAGLH